MIERGAVLDIAKQVINGQRQNEYGDPEDSFARIAAFWTAYLSRPVTAHDVAMMMCLLKVARAAGGSDKEDNYVDLCGYAALAAGMRGRMILS